MRRLLNPSTNIAAAARWLLLRPPGPVSCNGVYNRVSFCPLVGVDVSVVAW